jgi:arylsulfatase A-like enzyme
MLPSIVIALLFLLHVAGGSSGEGSVTATTDGTKPNILFVVVDDLAYGDVGFRSADTAAGGTGDIVTPNIDKLAKEGVVLSDYYVQPICSPTR